MIEAVPRARSIRARAHRVVGNRDVSSAAFVVRLERAGFAFRPGQWINLGRAGSLQRREYTVYSPEGAEFLEVLVKEVDGGTVSRELRRCREGDVLEVDGPNGSFCISPEERQKKFLFVGTGTGISPFHCLALSHAGLDYQLLHGVRSLGERYDHEVFDPARLVTCVSRGSSAMGAGPVYPGRVTGYLREHPVEPTRLCYLCGNSDMIYECYAILRSYGVPASRIFAEVYF